MNFLAHAYLSGHEEEVLIGNFIADSVKGRQLDLYPAGVARGIKLHRLIDAYTDTHPVVGETNARLRPKYRKFAPVISDIFFDHFLANQFHRYAQQPLASYTQWVYGLVQANLAELPERVQNFFPHMVAHNWLLSYAEVAGVDKALKGMSQRTSFESGMETAGEELRTNYKLYAADFEAFFPDLVKYVGEVKNQV